MRILHLTKNYSSLNGITTFIENLVNNDNLNDHYIISNYIEKKFLGQKIDGYLSTRINLSLLSFFNNIFFVSNICKKKRIDIIHSHHRYFDLLTFFVSKIIRVRTLNTVNSKVLGKKIFSYKADKLIAVGESIKNHLVNYFGIDGRKITVVNNFIDPQKIKITRNNSEIRTELNLDESHYVIGFAGRFDIREKGIDILVKASEKVIAKHSDVVFVFIGDGTDEYFLKVETSGMMANFRIINTKVDIYNYMQIFDQFVLPSRIDPFPLVMLEAAYLKIPFIGSNVDGISEFVNDEVDGLLFQSENSKELEKKIMRLKNDPNYTNKLVDKAYKKILNNYTTDQKVHEYYRIYEKLLGDVYN